MSFIERIKSEEDTRIACIFGFGVLTPVLTILGFYAGTVINKKPHGSEPVWFFDYQVADLLRGFAGAAVGFSIAAVIVSVILFWYPSLVHKHLELESGHH